MSIDQRFAVASLVGYVEGILSSGTLDHQVEWQLRIRIAEALVAFQMPAKSDHDASVEAESAA